MFSPDSSVPSNNANEDVVNNELNGQEPSNQQDFSDADLSELSMSAPPCEAPEYMREHVSNPGWLSSISSRTLAYLALGPAVVAGGAALAEPSDARLAEKGQKAAITRQAPNREEAVVAYAEESWKTIKTAIDQKKNLNDIPNIDSLWNNIQAVMHITDTRQIASLDKIRLEIIERGATDPQIPPRLVHGALYTMAVTGHHANLAIDSNRSRLLAATGKLEEINKQTEGLAKLKTEVPADLQANKAKLETEIASLKSRIKTLETGKEKMSAAAIPYLGKVIVDTQTAQGRRERQLIAPSEFEAIANRYPIVQPYIAKDFNRLAAYVIGQVSDPVTLDRAAKELLAAGNNTARRDTLLDIFVYARTGSAVPKEVLEQSKVWVFGREAIADHKKSLDAKSSAPSGKTALEATPSKTAEASPVDSSLLTPRFTVPAAKAAVSPDFAARNILLLAKNGDPLAAVAATQWFAGKSYADGMKMQSATDAVVLQALAISAQRDAKAMDALKKVGASFPDFVLGMVMTNGSQDMRSNPITQAHLELMKAISQNPAESREWMKSIMDRKAKLIWSEPSSEEDTKVVNDLRERSRFITLRVMPFIDNSNQFVETYRSILNNPFAQDVELSQGMVGVALAKDRQSVDALMARAVDAKLNPQLRSLALQAAMFIDTPEMAPEAVRQKAAKESPFSSARLAYFFPSDIRDAKRSEKLDVLMKNQIVNPFEARVSGNFNLWLGNETQLRAAASVSGAEPTAVSPAEKLSMMLNLVRREFGGNTSVLAEKGRDAEFASKYLAPMVSYLENAKALGRPLDMNLAGGMMMVLNKAGYTKAGAVFSDMAAYPERYVTNTELDGMMGLRMNAQNTAVLKLTALQNLGGVVDLGKANDRAAYVLHRVVQKNSSRIYREGAITGLKDLADRYDVALKDMPAGKGKDALLAARASHAKQCVDHMQYRRQHLESPEQQRLLGMYEEFKYAKLADRFGGTKALLELADAAISRDAKTFAAGAEVKGERDIRPVLVRSVMHALYSNGHGHKEIAGLGFDVETTKRLIAMYDFVNNQEYWLGKSEGRPTGKGREVAVFDVGYVLPLEITPTMNQKVIYPETLIRWTDLARSEEVHPTMVAWTIHQAAKDAKIRTYNVNASLREVDFRPAETQDPIFRAFEDLAQLELAGKADVDVINYSFGFPNILLNDAKARAEFVDQMSAYMEVLSRMDVKHAIAAANSHGANPIQARFGSLGEVNNLGLRFRRSDAAATQPDGIFVAAAHDAYTRRLGEFSSKGDELRTDEAVKMRSFQGVHCMLPEFADGRWGFEPGNGTSFASPNQAAMLLWGAEAVEASGVEHLTHKQWQELFDRCLVPLEGREDWEGGQLFSVPNFLKELKKATK